MNSKVELQKTQLHTLESKINFQKYDLYLRIPESYNQQSDTDKYDVIYILDGQWDFGLMLTAVGSAYHDELIPNIILVGISWNNQETDKELRDNRKRDFTATVSTGRITGGALDFLNVFETEIIPFVENSFSSSGIRCLFGGSSASWFALFAMFNRPLLFQKFVMSSPTIWTSNDLIFNYELLFSQTIKKIDAHMYICYGELEDFTLIQKFIETLEGRGYKDLQLTSEKIKGVGHAGNKPIGYILGLLNVYRIA